MGQAQEDNAVPGQGVLPGLMDVMRIESAVLRNPKQELFCWEFVTNGGDRALAYQVGIDAEADRLSAQKNAYKLLQKPEIVERITQISTIIQRKYEQQVIAYRLKGLTFDRGNLLTADNKLKSLSEMTEDERQIIDLEVKWVDGALRTIPVVASREKSAEALQKMMGMDKSKLEVTGKDGRPVETNSSVTIYIPSNGRD
jgi:hypothetical protein